MNSNGTYIVFLYSNQKGICSFDGAPHLKSGLYNIIAQMAPWGITSLEKPSKSQLVFLREGLVFKLPDTPEIWLTIQR